jgi:hypothetical protein
MARDPHAHDYPVDLVKRYGTDARGASTEMMEDRTRKAAWEARRERQVKNGKPDPGEYPLDHGLFGMRNKLARFMLTMAGGGNAFVPDTHFVRHLFGMDKSKDGPALEYLKTGVLWQPKNAHILGQLDRWYFENHPSVKYMLDHPQFGSYFKADPEQAVFPAFWAHWLCIAPHEAETGHSRTGDITNQHASHRPFFEESQRLVQDPNEPRIPARSPFNRAPPPGDAREPMGSPQAAIQGWNDIAKSETVPGGPLMHPVHAGALVRDWFDQLGPAGASFRFASSLLPLLMPEQEVHPELAKGVPTSIKLESMIVDVRRLESLLKALDTAGTSPETPSSKAAEPEQSRDQLSSKTHGIASLNTSPEQEQLVDNLNLDNRLGYHDEPPHASFGVTAPIWHRLNDGREAIVKHEGQGRTSYGPEKEVAYHNLARDFFGLGHFVPVTAAFRHPTSGETMSVQEAVPDAEHIDTKEAKHGLWPRSPDAPHQKAWLRQLHLSGDLDKVHLMNLMLGNGDRHDGNYVFSASSPSHLWLIDHGHAFKAWGAPQAEDPGAPQYNNQRSRAWIPRYSTQLRRMLQEDDQIDPMQLPIHGEAAKWLMGLDKGKLEQALHAYPFVNQKHPVSYLDQLQRAIQANPQISRDALFNAPDLRYR